LGNLRRVAPNLTPLYIQVDGGHLLTDTGYQEVKLGRVFKGSALKKVSNDQVPVQLRNQLESSDYLANLGHYSLFTARFEILVKNHLQNEGNYELVLISDGADWIANWQQEKYQGAVMILDFYHASEHLNAFAKMVFSSKEKRNIWIAKQRQLLLEGKIETVINHVRDKKKRRRNSIQDKADNLINYYEKNKYRMKYNQYLEKGYSIGSGAIESAIGTVVQQRCKLVGQRWTDRVNPVLNIRAVYMSKNMKIISHEMGGVKAA